MPPSSSSSRARAARSRFLLSAAESVRSGEWCCEELAASRGQEKERRFCRQRRKVSGLTTDDALSSFSLFVLIGVSQTFAGFFFPSSAFSPRPPHASRSFVRKIELEIDSHEGIRLLSCSFRFFLAEKRKKSARSKVPLLLWFFFSRARSFRFALAALHQRSVPSLLSLSLPCGEIQQRQKEKSFKLFKGT